MAEPEGIFSNTSIEFTSDGINPNVILTATTNSFTYTGATGSIDEVVVSGLADPILPNDSANKRYVDTRFYDIVIEPGTGTLSTAVASTNNISIYMKSGTYIETTDISLPENVFLIGENKNNTIIDFGTNDASLILSGGGTPYATGSISITNGTNTVTGVGTTFTGNISPGEYILLNETFYEVLSVGGATTLTLINTYNGVTLTGEAYVALPLVPGTFKNFTVQASGSGTASLLNLSSTIGAVVENVCFKNSRNHAIAFNNQVILAASTQTLITSCIIETSDQDGINMILEFQGNVIQTIIKNSGNNGSSIVLCRNLIFNGLNITNSGADGIFIDNILTNDILITDTISDNNNGSGYSTSSSANGIIFQSCTSTNNGVSGMTILGSNNTIGGSTLDLNTGTGITTGSSSSGNTITGNQININGTFGITFTSGSTNNIVSSNTIEGNSSGQINNTDGTSTSNTIYSSNIVGGIKDNAIFFAYDSVGGLAVTATAQTLPFNTSSSVNDNGYSLSSGEITVSSSGNYEISYWVQCESLNQAGAARTTLTGQVEVNTVLVPGSASSVYVREQNLGVVAFGCGKSVPVALSSGDVIRVRFFRGAQTTTAQTLASESSIYIKKLGS